LLPEYIVDRVRGLLEYPRYYREMERDGFDARYGTETAGIVEVGYGSLVGKKGEPLFRYQTASTFEITQAIGSLLIRHRDFTFVDIGSGKGKVLIVAQEYGFRRSIGVEISEELHRQAQQNIARLDTAAGAIELVCSDIEDFELPDGPTLFYMYNPLSEPLLTRFLARVEDSLRLRPRTVLFVYLNPVFGEVLDRAAFLRRVDTRTRWWSLYHSAPHPIRLRWTSAKPRPDVPRAGILIDD
ncbi:MAG: class I SAM-dependent methyltransferase, partial [Myxococcales bacterium]|nr:class I SAM-dependent methyltransferase [Myxococcales bacterium]